MNPRKLQACQFLIQYHEARGDKILVFSDNVFTLEVSAIEKPATEGAHQVKAYARKLGKLFIHGGVSPVERQLVLQRFQHDPTMNTIFLSQVGLLCCE